MLLRLAMLALLTVLACGEGVTQQTNSLRYAGTVGEQHAVLSLDVEGDAVTSGHYAYDRQKSDIRIVDSRVIGTTVVLQDEDGNILHLHFETRDGEKAGGWKNAAMLEGTLDRGELDLPVKLTRTAPEQKR